MVLPGQSSGEAAAAAALHRGSGGLVTPAPLPATARTEDGAEEGEGGLEMQQGGKGGEEEADESGEQHRTAKLLVKLPRLSKEPAEQGGEEAEGEALFSKNSSVP